MTLIAGTHRNFAPDKVVFGRPAAEVVAEETQKRGAERVFLITSRSLAAGELLAGIKAALGARLAGVFSEMRPHAPRADVVAAAKAARSAGADLLLAVGGGSACDGAKAVLVCLWEGVQSEADLGAFIGSGARRPSPPKEGATRMIAVPTLLSAAEFTAFAGVSDPTRKVKEGLGHPLCLPAAVVLDPAATLGTPVRLLKTTGMKAVDHAVEGALSIRPSPLAEAAAVKALDLLWRGLPGLGGAKDGAELRQDLQFASWLSIVGAGAGSPVGASHAIGHVLGGLGVAHGETTGVLLPAVLRWNAPANAERQKDLLASLGSPASDLPPDLATGIADLARRLEVPTRLRDLNLSRDLLGEIAEKTMAEASLRANPRKIASADQVGEILDLAW